MSHNISPASVSEWLYFKICLIILQNHLQLFKNAKPLVVSSECIPGAVSAIESSFLYESLHLAAQREFMQKLILHSIPVCYF